MKPYTELRQIAEAATPGPWRDCASCIEGALPAKGEAATVCVTPNPHARSGTKPGEKWRKDRAFIATFDPPTVLALLDRLAEVERELEGARAGAETPSLKRLLRASEIQQARAALDVIESYALGRGDDEGARSYANCIRKILAAELSSLRAPSEAASPESLGVSQDEQNLPNPSSQEET